MADSNFVGDIIKQEIGKAVRHCTTRIVCYASTQDHYEVGVTVSEGKAGATSSTISTLGVDVSSRSVSSVSTTPSPSTSNSSSGIVSLHLPSFRFSITSSSASSFLAILSSTSAEIPFS